MVYTLERAANLLILRSLTVYHNSIDRGCEFEDVGAQRDKHSGREGVVPSDQRPIDMDDPRPPLFSCNDLGPVWSPSVFLTTVIPIESRLNPIERRVFALRRSQSSVGGVCFQKNRERLRWSRRDSRRRLRRIPHRCGTHHSEEGRNTMSTSLVCQTGSVDSDGGKSFADFFQRVRAGDERAALELVKRYEPALRLEIRLRLGDPSLRRLLEPSDISQSVLRSFFSRAASGQFDLDSPQKLLGLLLTMARNKVALQARRNHTLRRDGRRAVSIDAERMGLAAGDPSPSRQVIGRETLDELRRRLSPEERQIAELRAQGCAWALVAAEMGRYALQARCASSSRVAAGARPHAREIGQGEDRDD